MKPTISAEILDSIRVYALSAYTGRGVKWVRLHI